MRNKNARGRPTAVSLLLAGLLVAGAGFAVEGADAQRRRTPASTMSTPMRAAAPNPGVININTASPEQLALLPGVGPSKARAIVTSRQRRRFRRIEEILRVRGIGRATFRRLRPMLRVDGPTTLAAPDRPQR